MKTVAKIKYREWMKKRLQYFRNLRQLSPSQVASLISMNPKTYGHYEEGVSTPSVFTLKSICDNYSITLDQFMEGSPVKEISQFETPSN